MKKQRFTAKSITFMGILMALDLIFSNFLSIPTQFVKISFAFIPLVLMGTYFSPLVSGAANAVVDLIGISFFPTGPFFPGFTVTAFLSGIIYSSFYYKKELTIKRIIVANLTITLFLNMFLNTLWLYFLYGNGVIAFIPARITSASILFVIHIIGTYWLSREKILKKQLVKFNS